MSPKKKKAGKGFVAVLVTGAEGGPRAEWIERMEAAFDGSVDEAAVEELPRRLARPGAVGVALIVPPSGSPTEAEIARILEACRASDPGLPLVVAADDLTGTDVARLFRSGIQDVIHSGEPEAGASRLRVFVERRAARNSGELFQPGRGVPRMLGSSPMMREVARLVEKVAPSDATVLILGESGTGKELIAQALHAFSPRKKGPFVAINCAAIPETLLENELFGHEKGSYTGANATAIGKVEAAEKGTLFLDEIGEMPIQLQAKILRLLQDRTYDRIGGVRTRTADIRIVTATNRELRQEVADKRFREDLYYRLSVVPISLPPLRDRPEDVRLLAHAILDSLAERLERPGLRFAPEALERLTAYRWPGNVRELENELERAAVLTLGDEIQPSDLELRARVDDPDLLALERLAGLGGSLEQTVERAAEAAARLRISLAIDRFRGDQALAAQDLGITVEELERRSGGDAE